MSTTIAAVAIAAAFTAGPVLLLAFQQRLKRERRRRRIRGQLQRRRPTVRTLVVVFSNDRKGA
jgi:hypothetical protein